MNSRKMAELMDDRTLLPADEQKHEAQHRRQVLEELRGRSSGNHPGKLTERRGLFSRECPDMPSAAAYLFTM
jgi:hypothetical protein